MPILSRWKPPNPLIKNHSSWYSCYLHQSLAVFKMNVTITFSFLFRTCKVTQKELTSTQIIGWVLTRCSFVLPTLPVRGWNRGGERSRWRVRKTSLMVSNLPGSQGKRWKPCGLSHWKLDPVQENPVREQTCPQSGEKKWRSWMISDLSHLWFLWFQRCAEAIVNTEQKR